MKDRNFSEKRPSPSNRPSSANIPGKKHAKLEPLPKKFQNSRQWLEIGDDDDDDYDGETLLGEEDEEE